jgi:hypothetical protein
MNVLQLLRLYSRIPTELIAAASFDHATPLLAI